MRADCPLLDEDAEITNTHEVKVSAEKCLLGFNGVGYLAQAEGGLLCQ